MPSVHARSLVRSPARSSHMRVASARVLSTATAAAAAAHGRYVVTMKGVAFEDQKLLALPSALSYDWLLPGVENGGPWSRPRIPFSTPSIRHIWSCRTMRFSRNKGVFFPGGVSQRNSKNPRPFRSLSFAAVST